MLNPNISQAVAAERMADMRRQAERYRTGREALAARRAIRRRPPAGQNVIHTAPAPVDPVVPAEVTEPKELCLTGTRHD